MDRPSRGQAGDGPDGGLRLRLIRPGFDLQGHRGARGLFAENTLEGFESAGSLGLSSFEIDIAVTRDGIPVLHHDLGLNPAIARGPDGRWVDVATPIHALTLAELEDFDVGRIRPGSAYAARYPGQVPSDGARIPTLEAVLAAQARARFNIELKLVPSRRAETVSPEAMADAVIAVVDRCGAAGRVTIQSFDWRGPRHVARVRPDLARGWLTEASTLADAAGWLGRARPGSVPGAIAEEGGGTWTPAHAELTEAALERAHALGLRVIPWTVNEADDMRRLIAWGVDGLITDHPERLAEDVPAA